MSYQFKHLIKEGIIGTGNYVFRKYSEQITPTEEYFLTFSSPNSFTLGIVGGSYNWDGDIEYSTDKENWTEWYGETIDSSQSGKLYLRGTGNTYVTGQNASTLRGYFALTGSDISISGNVENLLDHQMVENGQHPPVANYAFQYLFNNCSSIISAPELLLSHLTQFCYRRMFGGCTSLTTPPALPATILQASCYRQMFYGCTGLTSIPALPALEPLNYCYTQMFYNCSSIKLSTTQDSEYVNEYRIPITGTGSTSATTWCNNMFTNTGGTVTGAPTINTTYYTSNAVVAPGVIPPRPQTYILTKSVTNGAIIGNYTTIAEGETKTFTVTPNEGRMLPQTITVSNCSYTWNDTTGILVISNPTGNVSISITCPYEPYLTFSSPNSFTLSVNNNTKNWDGTLETSTDKTTWTTWDGTSAISSSNDGTKHNIYVRGIGNTYVTGYDAGAANPSTYPWRLNGSNISISGNIENLLDYATVKLGNHPAMANGVFNGLFSYHNTSPNGNITDISGLVLGAETLIDNCYRNMFRANTGITTVPSGFLPATTLASYCYAYMFNGCTSLTTAPKLPVTTMASYHSYCYAWMFANCTSLTTAPALPATTLANNCYNGMFGNCTSLTTAPALPATTLARACYYYMFSGCTSLYVSDAQTAETQYEWRIPTNTVISGTTYLQPGMFAGCPGTHSSNDLAGEVGQQYIYYTQNQPVGSN